VLSGSYQLIGSAALLQSVLEDFVSAMLFVFSDQVARGSLNLGASSADHVSPVDGKESPLSPIKSVNRTTKAANDVSNVSHC
jgi:hypothetical protein